MHTILLVDDSRVAREVLKVFLIGRQARVLEAGNGRDGLRMMREHQPDLVIADLEMPELDGLGFLETIRYDARLRATPVLVLSGHTTADLRRKARDLGALEVLQKPVQPHVLLAAVDRHLPLAPRDHGLPI